MYKRKGSEYMDIVQMKISELVPYDKNPRINDDAVKYVVESIKEFGFKVPIVLDAQNVIIAGHTRWKAAKKLKLKEVPCIIADDLTDEQIKAFRLADNKVSEQAEWDYDLLSAELDDLVDFDMSVFGFEEEVVEEKVPKERKDLSGEVGETYEVIVECRDELEQEEVYYKLINEGLTCRTLIL